MKKKCKLKLKILVVLKVIIISNFKFLEYFLINNYVYLKKNNVYYVLVIF